MQQHDMEGGQIQAISNLPPDLMMLKMENESIMAVARAAPREPMKIVRQLQDLIDAYPAAADEAIYSKPVGTVIEVTCRKCGIRYEVNKVEKETTCPDCETEARDSKTRKVKKFAEGLSIRAAESIRSIYGYTRLATTQEQLPDDRVKITGVLVDYAAGNVTSDERIVSPWYKSRYGGMTKTPEDRFLNVVVKAEKSKLRRDVILDNTPSIVKAMFRDACEQKMAQLVSPEVVEQKILPAFAHYGITPEHLDTILGRPRALGWREEDRLELRKILNALKNEETTARELLDGLKADTPQTQQDAVTVEDLTKPAKPAKPNEPPKRETPPVEPSMSAELELLDQYRDSIAEADTITTLRELARHAEQSEDLSDAALETVNGWIGVREQEIRAKRGGRSNGGKTGNGAKGELFDTAASATEGGM